MGSIGVSAWAEYPRVGRARPDIAPDARMLAFGSYIVLYRVADAAVDVVRVLHGARDIAA